MCVICFEYEKGTLTRKEALKNIEEILHNPHLDKNEVEHLLEVEEELEDSLDYLF